MMTLITGFTCPPTIYFKFITKCDKCYYKVRQLFYYKVRQVLLQSATGITKCDDYHDKVRQNVHTLVNTLCTHLRFRIFFSPKERSALNMCTGDRPCKDICSKFSPRSKKGSTESQARGWCGLWVRLRSIYTSWFILEWIHLNTWNQKRLLIHLPHCHIVSLMHLASRVVWISQNRPLRPFLL